MLIIRGLAKDKKARKDRDLGDARRPVPAVGSYTAFIHTRKQEH